MERFFGICLFAKAGRVHKSTDNGFITAVNFNVVRVKHRRKIERFHKNQSNVLEM